MTEWRTCGEMDVIIFIASTELSQPKHKNLKIQMLPTTINAKGCATAQQHSCCLIIDDRVAIDAGSLAMSVSDVQRAQIRDVVLTHAHLDHIAGLPLFIDDLFASLTSPVTVYAMPSVIESLENHIFNWTIYPRFSELENDFCRVLRYQPLDVEKETDIAHLKMKAVEVNHKVPSVGFIFSDNATTAAISGDTSEMDRFWDVLNKEEKIGAIFMECAFPDYLSDIAASSHHLTPKKIKKELKKCRHQDSAVYLINLKPMYREPIVREISALGVDNLKILEVGKVYNI